METLRVILIHLDHQFTMYVGVPMIICYQSFKRPSKDILVTAQET